MLKTVEVRWFYSGTLPEAVERWFQHDCPGEDLAPPAEREDLYLSTAGCEHVGIKLRQEKLEVKWREAELGLLDWGQAEGNVEQWIKWTCDEAAAAHEVPDHVVAKRLWLKVFKARSQRRYQSPNQSVIATPADQAVNPSCSVELTTLKLSGSWWSLAFEASGDSARDTLQAVAEDVFKTYRGPQLQAQDSYAYPKWLSIASL